MRQTLMSVLALILFAPAAHGGEVIHVVRRPDHDGVEVPLLHDGEEPLLPLPGKIHIEHGQTLTAMWAGRHEPKLRRNCGSPRFAIPMADPFPVRSAGLCRTRGLN